MTTGTNPLLDSPYGGGVRSPTDPVRDEHGRLWVNSSTDTRALDWLAHQMAGEGVAVVDPVKRVLVTGTLDGVPLYGEVRARRRGVQDWEGLVLLEREYAPGWWHLQARWVPAAHIEVLGDAVGTP